MDNFPMSWTYEDPGVIHWEMILSQNGARSVVILYGLRSCCNSRNYGDQEFYFKSTFYAAQAGNTGGIATIPSTMQAYA